MLNRVLSLLGMLAVAAPLLAQQPGWTIVGWRIALQADRFPSFADGVEKAAAAGIPAIEGHATQLDWELSDTEIAAARQKLRSSGVTMPAYHAPEFPPEEAGARKLFQFAKAMAVETIIADPPSHQLALADQLANEYGVSLALHEGDFKARLQALEGRSKRMGVCVDTAANLDGWKLAKDRILTLQLHDANPGLNDFLREIYRSNIKPSAMTVDVRSVPYLRKMTLAVLADYIDTQSRTTQPRFAIADAERQQIETATPAAAAARPRKPRKLLVVDMQAGYGGHRSLPYANVAIQSMARKTGAFEPVFNNDFANLRYDKLRQYDALYLNNTVGPIFNSEEVRESLLRYVREGGGLGGHHGTGRASLDWPEFAVMLGSYAGPHAVSDEKVTLKVDDPTSPIAKGFGFGPVEWTGEFFRFPSPPYTREKLHVLLSIDAAKTDMKRYTCAGCQREDNDYAVSWIRAYQKGRVFYTNLGHNPSDFFAPAMVEHVLAGIQYILGDLDSDSTPSGNLRK